MNCAPQVVKPAILAQQVSVAEIDAIWPMIAPEIVKCLAKTPSYFTAGDLWTMCRAGNAFLIAVHDGVNIRAASVWQFEGANFACLMLVGKGADDWIAQLIDAAKQIAKNGGATQVMATCRVGLSAKAKRHLPTMKIIRHTLTVEV